ncbi:cytochrome c-type biogenesis protein [Acidiphilium sp. C61]|jgi:cytochrome c-type biogenesis protein CcmH|uniref:cytochrome c-type biogenesis protein n=1 Tax=Acidiphilium sp. C61 TaxID=1671485 RepID=UPI00157A466F|nr:cytochrome c-type biogenesis protein [Acidiphilium sp. C61]
MRRWLVLLVAGLALACGTAMASPAAPAPSAGGDHPTSITRDGVKLTFAQEERAEAIGNKLRCLVCQNETVENSRAGLAKQFRTIIRHRVAAGDSNRQIIAFMVKRYGIYVLLKPPFRPETWLLWLSPGIAAIIGLAVLLVARRRRRATPPPLSPEETDRLKELLS